MGTWWIYQMLKQKWTMFYYPDEVAKGNGSKYPKAMFGWLAITLATLPTPESTGRYL
ncbi:hypothetical protein I311_04371 [Cryptococcus gattii NT-10]|nr:hypothetical protein I311_04371 [Cryptococcus gattii NT-10]